MVERRTFDLQGSNTASKMAEMASTHSSTPVLKSSITEICATAAVFPAVTPKMNA